MSSKSTKRKIVEQERTNLQRKARLEATVELVTRDALVRMKRDTGRAVHPNTMRPHVIRALAVYYPALRTNGGG